TEPLILLAAGRKKLPAIRVVVESFQERRTSLRTSVGSVGRRVVSALASGRITWMLVVSCATALCASALSAKQPTSRGQPLPLCPSAPLPLIVRASSYVDKSSPDPSPEPAPPPRHSPTLA